jgi:PBSX family phage terminase large subunit
MSVFHFHIDDNGTLTPEYVRSLKTEYTGLWYRRFIDGEWVQAQGVVYDMWDENRHIMPKSQMPDQYDKIFASCDYGTTNPFAAGLYGVCGQKLYKIKEYHYDSHKQQRQKTDSEYADDMITFLSDQSIPLVIDPSAASFKAEMKKRGRRVIDADNSVLDGIRLHASLLTNGRFFISPECAETKLEYPNYVWDKRAQDRGEDVPLKENDHHMDEGRYACMYAFGFKKRETYTGTFRGNQR